MIQLQVRTSGRQSFEDITSQVQQAVSQSGVQEGLCHLFCPHTTAGLTVNENWDPSVQHDMGLALDDLVPQRRDFRHSEGNSPAHVKSSLVGASQTLFVDGGRLVLGSWQGIYLAEFDGPRTRKVLVKVVTA
ncbi:MAG: YjbQ family protein [Anaerolineales bacterium]|nr:MAG: YjbQ family protein [Anaerolineales bacterium]